MSSLIDLTKKLKSLRFAVVGGGYHDGLYNFLNKNKNQMKEQISEWIIKNGEEVKLTVKGAIWLNLVVIAISILSGEFIAMLISAPRILVAEAMFFVPAVYAIKYIKENY